MVPGGFSANATEVEQEGLRLPPVKLYKKGELDEEILAIILSNIRVADQRIGDIKAQTAALAIGERRLTRAARPLRRRDRRRRDRRAEAPRRAQMREQDRDDPRRHLRRRGVRRHRRRRRRAADDRAADHQERRPDLDRARCRSTERLVAAVPGPMNSVIATTQLVGLPRGQARLPRSVPINAGTFEPLHIVDPDGTFLYARYPRPVSGCAAEVSQRIAEAVFAALAQGDPRALFAAPAGTSGNFGVGGCDPEKDRAYVMYVISGGGYGGSPSGDGISQRLLDDRHLEDAADRGPGAALPGAVRGVLAARRLGRRRRAPRRLRRQLPHPAAPRRGARLVRDGPRPLRTAGRAGRRRRRRQQGQRHPRRRRSTCRRISRRTRTSRSAPATSSRSRRPAAAATAPAEARPAEARARDVALGYYSAAESERAFGRTP